MNKTVVSVTEVARHFSDFVNRVAYRHESFVLCRGKKQIAELSPLPVGKRLGDLPGLLRSLPQLEREDTEAFAREINEARDSLGKMALPNPWEL